MSVSNGKYSAFYASGKRILWVRGTQGSPFVRSHDEDYYVCLWRDHLRRGCYCDAGGTPGEVYWEKQAALLRTSGFAVLTISEQSSHGWKRKDYHSLWRVEDVKLTENGLECRFVERICEVVRGAPPKKRGPSGGAAPLPQAA